MSTKSTAAAIKKLRLKLGLTQEGFARELGVTLSTVNRWETGRSDPSALAKLRLEELRNRLAVDERTR